MWREVHHVVPVISFGKKSVIQDQPAASLSFGNNLHRGALIDQGASIIKQALEKGSRDTA